MMEELEKSSALCFTMDIDWASESAIRYAVSYFLEAGIPLTVFCTHKSAYLNELIGNGQIDAGIHPNFVQPSSQGETEDEIIRFCLNVVPETKVFRCHRWYAVNDIYEKLYAQGFRYESNICTLLDPVRPFLHRSGMISFPVFFEDGAYLYHKLSLHFEEVQARFTVPGLKVVNVHPMHFALNTPYFSYMREIKDHVSREDWNRMSETELQALRFQGRGIADFTRELVNHAVLQKQVVSLKDAYEKYAPSFFDGQGQRTESMRPTEGEFI